jgi:lambda family phage portal protein
VPASDIFHLRIVDRWPQTRGEPWLHTVLRKLDDMNEYSQHEVTAARASAAYFGTIESTDDQPIGVPTEEGAAAPAVMDIEPLSIQQLEPGEELKWHSPNRPNVALDPFMRAMLREVAAGTGTSYESLSRDYSQSNYSSSRLALLDDRDLYKALQQWWLRSFREPLHMMWLQQAVLARAIVSVPVEQYGTDPAKFEAVLFKPRGWSWIDPTKEVGAYKEAVKAGLTTLTDVIAATGDGRDIEDVITTRKRELKMLDEAGIDADTTVPDPADLAAPTSAAPSKGASDSSANAQEDAADPPSRIRRVRTL